MEYETQHFNASDAADILRIFDTYEAQEELFWRVNPDGTFHLFVMCSDSFMWGSADAEDITPQDIGDLQKAKHDLKDHSDYIFWPLLWVSRKRGEPVMDLLIKQAQLTHPAWKQVKDKVK